MINADVHVDGVIAKQTDWPIVHNAMKPNRSTPFFGVDDEQKFIENKNKLSKDWIYNEKIINYSFNGHGLRMDKELAQVDSDYLAAFGCSHSMGLGVCLEDSWPYIMSQQLGIDYINSAVVGASVKLTAINFFNMLSTVKTLPKIVAIAWPHAIRHTWYSQGAFLFYLPRHNLNREQYKIATEVYENMLASDLTTTEAVFYRHMVKTTCNRLDIKYCETSFDPYCDFAKTTDMNVVTGDGSAINSFHARDIQITPQTTMRSHPGIGQHLKAVEILTAQL